MPYNNSNAITSKEFYTGVAKYLGVTPATVKHYIEDGIALFIINEMKERGCCRIPMIGNFGVYYIPESYSKQTDVNGNEVVYEIPERIMPVFEPSDGFINDINGRGVTKAYRKRAKKGKLTRRDYERMATTQFIENNQKISQNRMQEAKENFIKKLHSEND